MAKKKDAPIGFGRQPMPDEAGNNTNDDESQGPPVKQLEPPLAEPIFVDSVMMYELFQRYNLQPLTHISPFEYHLVQVIAGLEKRVRELDHDL